MKWDKEKSKAQAIFYWIATIVLILVVIGMLTDFISWKTAIGMIKKQMPTNGAYNELENYKFNWLWFTHPAQFHIYIASDENLNIKPYYSRYYGKTVQGRVDGVLPGVGGFNAPLINNRFETDVKSIKGVWHLKGQIYVLDKGKKIYNSRKRTALLGIVYTVDGISHFDFIREAWRINCHGGGYIWSDLR